VRGRPALVSLEDAVCEIATGNSRAARTGLFPDRQRGLGAERSGTPRRTFRNVEVRFDDGEPDLLLPRLVEDDLDIIVAGRSAADRARCGEGQASGPRALSAPGSAARAPTTSANDKGMF
jgi:hypothetical protein